MTVSELIAELSKLDNDTQVWVDTESGLMTVDGIYSVVSGYNENINTAIITYSDSEYKGIKQ